MKYNTDKEQEAMERINQLVDLKIPLWGLLGAAAVVGWALISTYFSVNQLVRTVDDLQITVKSGNQSNTVVAGEVSLLKFRLSSLEDDVKRLNESQRNRKN